MAVWGMDAAVKHCHPPQWAAVRVLVPAVARLLMFEDIWPAIVHGMLLGTKTEVTGPGAPAVLDLKPRSRLGKEIFCPHPGASWCKTICPAAIIHNANFLTLHSNRCIPVVWTALPWALSPRYPSCCGFPAVGSWCSGIGCVLRIFSSGCMRLLSLSFITKCTFSLGS